MDTKSRIFFLVFALLIVGSIAASYYRFMVKRDYIVEAQTDCDPYAESCFVWECDPEAGGECTGNPSEDTWYYKLIRRNAMNIPACDSNEEGCEALVCPEGEAECEEVLCSPEILLDREEEGECTDTELFTLEHPVEAEEGSEGVEGADVEGGVGSEASGTVPEESDEVPTEAETSIVEPATIQQDEVSSGSSEPGKTVPITINGKTYDVVLSAKE